MLKGTAQDVSKTSGNVIVTVKDFGKVREIISSHNSGTINLSKFLRDALIGEATLDRVPDRIVPFECNDEKTFINELLTYGIQFYETDSITEDEDTSSAKVSLKFLIPNSVLENGSEINGFNLYSGKLQNANKYATVFLTTPVEVKNGTTLLIEWKLIVSPAS